MEWRGFSGFYCTLPRATRKPMAYSKFTLEKALKELELTLVSVPELFLGVAPVAVSEPMAGLLKQYLTIALGVATEKARSEYLVAPLLFELRQRTGGAISIFSGVTFDVDPARGLAGACDFLLAKSPEQNILQSPVFAAVESKSENLRPGLGQCLAEMVAVQLFNQQEGHPLPTVWGTVTSGLAWRFMKLEGQTVYLENQERSLGDGSEVLGILLHIAEGK
jgi:hypothetical protein